MPTIGMNFSRPGAQVVGQYFNFIHLGFEGYQHRMKTLEAIACYLADSIAKLGPLRLVSHPFGQLPVFAVSLDPAISNWTSQPKPPSTCCSFAFDKYEGKDLYPPFLKHAATAKILSCVSGNVCTPGPNHRSWK